MRSHLLYGALLTIATTLSGYAAASEEQRVEPQRVVSGLEAGGTRARLETLVTILNRPAVSWDLDTWQALQREASRMLPETRRLQPPGDHREVVFAYAAGLARALAERRDPIAIPLLIEYSAFVSYAIDGLVEFGETAVPLLLTPLDRPNDNLSRTSGVTVALAKILERSNANAMTAGLSGPTREILVTTARRLMGSEFNVGNLLGTTMLALATGDPVLRAQLEKLSESREAWTERGVTAPSTIALGQQVIRSRLRLAPGKPRG